MKESLDFDYLFKYILVGDSSVGKSSLLSTFIKKTNNDDSQPTMGVEFATKKLQIKNKIIKLQIWDTAGQQAFRTITRAYYKNAIGVLLLYDLTNPKSVDSLDGWIKEIQDNSSKDIHIIIVGNKNDIYKGQKIQLPESICEFKTYISSAKTGQNVHKIFSQLTVSILKRLTTGQINADEVSGIKKGISTQKLQRLENESEGSRCC